MNIYDISRLAGVSTATVSRVLNGSERVSETTRQKVLQTMRENGYTPNAFARGLGLGSMRMVGLLLSDVADAYQAKATALIERALRDNGYDCLLFCAGDSQPSQEKYLSMLLEKKVDGVMLISSNFIMDDAQKNAYILAAARQVPVVLVNGALAGDNVYCALCDDERATHEAAQHLIASGARRIVYLYHSKATSGQRKCAGFFSALEAAGIPLDENALQFCPGDDMDAVCEHLCALQKSMPFDAVLCSEDKLAVGAVRYAARENIRIPEDLQIIGYNDSTLARCTTPELTSVNCALNKLCQSATDTLMAALRGEAPPRQTILQGALVPRGTTR